MLILSSVFRPLLVLALLLAPLGAAPRAARQKGPPNILIILIDDLGGRDLGRYGSTFHRTPHLDRLAAQGMTFTDAYAAAPVCSPSRAALLTGQHPARLHLTDWLPGRADNPAQKLLRPAIRPALPLGVTTLPEALKPAGYAAASIGKWHLGGRGFGPLEQGFELNVAGDHTGTPASYFFPFRNRHEAMPGLERGREGEYLTDRLTDEAERFIEQNRARPFLLYLAHFAVHIPMKAKAELVEKYGRERAAGPQRNPVYAAMIESVDESVGRLMRKLDELRLRDNTLVIFTSDNGGLSVAEGPHTPATSNAPLRDGKGYLYEGGLRVPLIVRWPAGIPPGSISREPVCGIDILPTVLDLARLRAPARLDGSSLRPLFEGRRQRGFRRDALYWHYPHYSNQGGTPGGAIREGDYKLIEFYEDGRLELYNLARDGGETTNLAARLPARAAALRGKLARWRTHVGAQMPAPNPAYRGT